MAVTRGNTHREGHVGGEDHQRVVVAATGAEPVARSVVVEEMEDPVVVLGRDGRPVDLNRAARTRLGLEIRGPLPLDPPLARGDADG